MEVAVDSEASSSWYVLVLVLHQLGVCCSSPFFNFCVGFLVLASEFLVILRGDEEI